MPIQSVHPAYERQLPLWKRCRDFYTGELSVKAKGEMYLPKPEVATQTEYQNYVKRAFFFGAMSRTVSGLTGIIDRKPPTAKLSSRTEYLEENTDGNDTPLRQFSKLCLDECFITGRDGLLVDRDTNGGKPYIVLYKAEDIINWAETSRGVFSLVVLRETYAKQDPSDPYIVRDVIRYRELIIEDGIYKQRIYETESGNKADLVEEIIPTNLGESITEIPFIFVNVNNLGATIDKPPLLDLVVKNEEQYRIGADYANALYFTGNPILWVKGSKRPEEGEFEISIGSSRAIHLPSAESAIGFAECNGHGVNPNRDRFNDAMTEMAVLGARLLEGQKKAAETAETSMIRQGSENSILYGIVITLSFALQKAIKIIDKWEGGDGKDILFSLNTDFIALPSDSNTLAVLGNMAKQGLISWDTFFQNLYAGEYIPLGRTAREEMALIKSNPVSEFVTPSTTENNTMFVSEEQKTGDENE